MDKLVSLYEQLKKLRDAGVKMKDISEETNITSSVLSFFIFVCTARLHQQHIRRQRQRLRA